MLRYQCSVRLRCEKNRMTSRNLGVVFGRKSWLRFILIVVLNYCYPTATLMRSRDPGAEFSDMAGKALFIEWLIENAPVIFNESN